MGCFCTKGFFSGIDIDYKDKAFVLVCTQYGSPIDWVELKTKFGEHDYEGTVGTMYPISFPIFGDYNSYGELENIVHDFNTDKIESIIEDSVENFLDILNDATVFPHCMNREQINKYNKYKEKFGLVLSKENLEKDYYKYKLERVMSLEDWIDGHMNSTNQELIWTMDHSFVYNTLGGLYKNCNKKEILDPALSTIWTNFKLVWGDEIYKHPDEINKFLSFIEYLNINRFRISPSYCTSQDIYWDKIQKYINALKNFVDKKAEDY